MGLDPSLVKKLQRYGTAEEVIECMWNGKAAGAAFIADRFVLVAIGFGNEVIAPYVAVQVLGRDVLRRRLRCHGMEPAITFSETVEAERFDAALTNRGVQLERAPARAIEPVAPDRVTTLPGLPGYRIVRVVGAVTELCATSGLTATMKGNSALDSAMENLRRSAADQRANAIVGLTSSAFGAAGGITSALGGDAVGVVLIGTGVVVEPEERTEATDPPH